MGAARSRPPPGRRLPRTGVRGRAAGVRARALPHQRGLPGPADPGASAASLRHSLARAAAIGARGVVVHTGSALGGDHAAALGRVRGTLLPVLDSLPALDSLAGHPLDLLLEPMAGQGSMLCGRITDLGPYLEALSWHPRAAVCLDTCHLFAAGHDLTAPGAVDAVLAGFAGLAGPAAGGEPAAAGRLRLIHANDSRDGCGSRRDRHHSIGAGQIGTAPFARLLAHPATAGVPFIVETPGPRSAHAADIAALKTLRDQQPHGGAPGPAGCEPGGKALAGDNHQR